MTATPHALPSRRPLALAPLAALLALSLAACGSSPSTDAAPAPDAAASPADAAPAEPASPPGAASTPEAGEAPAMAAQCDADAAQAFVGKEATDATVADAKAAAGAKGDVRVVKPGQPVTMDYRGDRLNIAVDERNLIVRISCG